MKILPVNYNFSVVRNVNVSQNNQFHRVDYDTVSFSSKAKINIFDNYKPKKFDDFFVHNQQIKKRMKSIYSSKEFNKLFEFVQKKGAFNLDINKKTNYITTSLIDPKENPLMGKLVWVTDSARYMPILKDNYPKAAVPLLENISKFYAKQERNFQKVINDPIWYDLNEGWPSTAKYGIGHVFNPNNLTTHKWFAHTRLDSPGLYLQTASDLILDGFNGAKYGYKNAEEVPDKTVDAIANVTSYLKSVVYPYTKDTGAWEEITFDITPSSDVAIINEGFRKVLNLMYSKTTNPELLKIRARILHSKNGKVFQDEKSLRELLKAGEYRIKTNSLEEVPNVRNLDGAMSFIAHSESFSDDVLEDARQIVARLKAFENKENGQLSRENGVIRYVGDRYLNLTSGHEVNKGDLPKGTEAQWFMTSDISKSYGMAVKKLLNAFEKGLIKKDEVSRDLLTQALKGQVEYVNRAYGRVTGERSFKANGKPCPAFQIPEAYQAVRKSNGEIIFVPGDHTPLGWAQASLYDASKLLAENLTRIEKLNLI